VANCNENNPCWFTLESQPHFKLSGADTKLWASKIMERSTSVEYPPVALLALFTEREDAEKEAKRIRRAERAKELPRIKGSSRSSSSKDRSRERSNKERSAQSSMVSPRSMVQNQAVYAPPYQQQNQWMGPPQGMGWAPLYGYSYPPQQYFAPPSAQALAPHFPEPVNRVVSSSPPFNPNADDMIRTEFKSKGDEEPLLLPASKNNDETGFNMASLRASSPLRSDIPIDAQLDAFHGWLKKHLPQNRQARLGIIFAKFAADETAVDDIRYISSDEVILKTTLAEIKKQVSPFIALYKREVGQAQTLVDLSKGMVDVLKEVDEEDEEDDEAQVRYKDDSQLLPGQQEFDNDDI
jgi:hypothetical protein